MQGWRRNLHSLYTLKGFHPQKPWDSFWLVWGSCLHSAAWHGRDYTMRLPVIAGDWTWWPSGSLPVLRSYDSLIWCLWRTLTQCPFIQSLYKEGEFGPISLAMDDTTLTSIMQLCHYNKYLAEMFWLFNHILLVLQSFNTQSLLLWTYLFSINHLINFHHDYK